MSGLNIIYKHAYTSFTIDDFIEDGLPFGKADDSGVGVKLWDGYHLHFQIDDNGQQADPILYLLDYVTGIQFKFSVPPSSFAKVRKEYEQKDYWSRMTIMNV